MDVKYIVADWEKMKDGLGDLIGLGRWGKGMIDELKDLTENLEDAESDITKYDSDGIISFNHRNKENKYQELFDDFKVLHDFTGKVGDIVDRTIDQPFYEDIDAFVTAMREATISNYTTKNRIHATEEKAIYQGYGAIHQTRKVPKAEVSLDDLLSGDNFYAEQIKLEYETWKAQYPEQDFSMGEYRMAAVNIHAFEYESIKDQQYNKEFWVNIGALVTMVGATVVAVVAPPVGVPLALSIGAAYGTMELGTAVTGKDWVSGRELESGERLLRGALSPLDIVPGVAGIKKFSSSARFAHQAANMRQFGVKTGVQVTAKQEWKHVKDTVLSASQYSKLRIKNAGAVVKDKLAVDAIEVRKAADTTITKVHQIPSTRQVLAIDEVEKVHMPAGNTSSFENAIRNTLSKAEGVNIGKGKVVGEKNVNSTGIISKYDDIYNYDYNFFDNPGPLAQIIGKPIKNFYGGRYNIKVLTEDIYLYRSGEMGGLTIPGKQKNGLGQWFTSTPAQSVAQVRIDTAVKPLWIDPKTGVLTGTSPINATYKVKIPKGTTIYEGPVGYQGGVYSGGLELNQIYIQEPWKIRGVEVISETTIK
ncbi:MAG: PT-TG domain-containing protein [Virgibacillus proomii]|jgi:hypothetical protein